MRLTIKGVAEVRHEPPTAPMVEQARSGADGALNFHGIAPAKPDAFCVSRQCPARCPVADNTVISGANRGNNVPEPGG